MTSHSHDARVLPFAQSVAPLDALCRLLPQHVSGAADAAGGGHLGVWCEAGRSGPSGRAVCKAFSACGIPGVKYCGG